MDASQQQVPYHVRMDSEDALKLVKQGASLLILDVPPSTSFGIDQQMFVVGPNFKGVKMMPPGPHFIYYSVASRHGGDTSPITGFFLYVSSSEVIVKSWDPKQERVVNLPDENEAERYAHGVRNMEFDANLAPYDLPHHATWWHLSNYINQATINRLQPVGGDISIMAEAALVETGPMTQAEKKMYEHSAMLRQRFPDFSTPGDNQGSQPSSSGRCFYTRLPGLVKRVGMSTSELTAMNLDKSEQLESVLKDLYGGEEDLLLGEFQFAFIAFLMGQSLEAFGQWKALVSFLFGCNKAPLQSRTKFFAKFLDALYWQLKQGLKGNATSTQSPTVDDSWFTDDIFLRYHYKNFIQLIRDAQAIDGDLLNKTKRLRKLVESVLGWTVDEDTEIDEDDEYAPVVVSEEDATIKDD
ncbi:hypothetical protein KC19_7G006300 [Ceratodon purpureus]|uniref:Protein AAR2 homolog n=1 Tax=Ceratodon purpureus TaxID=3225 RepID=A0A8T0H690_CERPU|nr:hypothetical protein KC19_7G006300 [Ceratodon purpureus]